MIIEEIFVTLIVIFSIAFVALFWRDVFLLTISLLVVSLFTLRHFHKRNDTIIFLVGGVSGAIAEFVCIFFGAWTYSNPTFFIPLWLPILWGLAALVIRRFSIEIDKVK